MRRNEMPKKESIDLFHVFQIRQSISETSKKEKYLVLLEILCVKLQRVEFNGERARVSDCDFSFSLSAGRQARPQFQHRWPKLEFWLLTLTLCCNEHSLSALSHMDH